VLVRKEQLLSQTLGRFQRGGVLLAIMLILAPHILGMLFMAGVFTVPLGDSCEAIGFAMLILLSIFFPGGFAPLNWPVIRNLGVLSYSLYIWQQLFCASPNFFGWSDVWFMSMPGWLVAALMMAMLSYYCFEKPLLGLRARFRPVAT
jgi:peptidoglycan/LPS O-acetylase OafA/YrhL